MVAGWVYDRDQGEDWSNTGDSGRDPGLAGKTFTFLLFWKILLLCKIANFEIISKEAIPAGKSRDLCTFEYLFTSCTVEGREKWGLFYLGKPLHWSKESDFGREKSEVWERLMDCRLPQGNSLQIIEFFSRWNYWKWCWREVYIFQPAVWVKPASALSARSCISSSFLKTHFYCQALENLPPALPVFLQFPEDKTANLLNSYLLYFLCLSFLLIR